MVIFLAKVKLVKREKQILLWFRFSRKKVAIFVEMGIKRFLIWKIRN